ncbi:hypothetical protein VPNG_03118 [Cytospora leucostoma]|uniref:Uncharacterized protein n=1 Tax=Cytospora leucostoma TaxID=1230097 RepID=A0A423XEF3_9PEZI|nr:hypothetical protein VPNG_03118 [Cytospora leucostoma]
MNQGEMGHKGLKKQGVVDFRGVTLEELDKYAENEDATVIRTYLGWLQEHLNDWDLSDSASLRPQIDSWCASLRLHGADNQGIFDAFGTWSKDEIHKDPTCARRLGFAEQELHDTLFPRQSSEQASSEIEHGRVDAITVRENKIIDISSGGEDSDLEILAWTNLNDTPNAAKALYNTNTTNPHSIADNQETQLLDEGADGGHNPHARMRGTKARKNSTSSRSRGPVPINYVCYRCNRKGEIESFSHLLSPEVDQAKLPTGHHLESCPTNLDPSYDTPPPLGAGVDTGQLATSMGLDGYHPAYIESRKRTREPFRDVDATYIHEDRRALLERLEDDEHHSKPYNNADKYRGSHYSPPLAKRSRRGMSEKQLDRQSDRGQRGQRGFQEPRKSRGRSPLSSNNRKGSTELFVRYSSERDGRLSYWDDSYGDTNIPDSPTFSSKRLVATDFWRPDNTASDKPEAAMQLLWPEADASWVSDMVSFDVDNFFAELDGFMENGIAPSKTDSDRAHCADAEDMLKNATDGHPDAKGSGSVIEVRVNKSRRQGTS